MDNNKHLYAFIGVSLAAACTLALTHLFLNKDKSIQSSYSTADQSQRHATAREKNVVRVMNIDAIYDPSFVMGKTVLITGNSFGISLNFN